jgi:hypothetical protein
VNPINSRKADNMSPRNLAARLAVLAALAALLVVTAIHGNVPIEHWHAFKEVGRLNYL